jgi:hypothetical protein
MLTMSWRGNRGSILVSPSRAFDGRPLAYAATEAELERRLRAMDVDPEAVVIDFVAPPHLSDAT